MKRLLVALPFVTLTASAAALMLRTEAGPALGVLFVASFFGCLLSVPIISRQRLALGYAALLYPFLVILLGVFLDRKQDFRVTTTVESQLRWKDEPKPSKP